VRVIVVETNPLKPDSRYRRSGPTPGLVDVLYEECSLDQAITPPEGDRPERIAIGLTVDRHLTSYKRLAAVLQQLRERYEVILLDAPPVLLSADTEFLAGVADATLLVVRSQQVRPGELKRAVVTLERIDPPLVGVIVNCLQVFQGGGYYSEMVDSYRVGETAVRPVLKSLTAVKRTA
jgi:Mrp family chromosome partitioning ATPase